MAHFLAAIKGHRGEASRLGSKKSGLDATAASWQGAVDVRLWHDAKTGRDMARVSLIPWHGAGSNKPLYYGPVSGATCECSDSGCQAHMGKPSCGKPVAETLYRCDMEDETGVAFCAECAEDAANSGVFSCRED
jgi:hypothetical protein